MSFHAAQTAVDSIAFGFKRLITALKLTWVPTLVIIAGISLSAFLMYEGINDDDPSKVIATVVLFYGLLFLAMLAYVPAYAMLTRTAAGTAEVPGGIAYWTFGGRELRVVGAAFMMIFISLLVSLLALMPMLVVGLGSALMNLPVEVWSDPDMLEDAIEAAAESGDLSPLGLALTILSGLLGVAFIIWFSVRAMTFIPSTAIENRISFGAAFKETKGSFWKLFLGSLLLHLMRMAVSYGFIFLMMIPTMGIFVTFIEGGMPESMSTGGMIGLSLLTLFGGLIYLALMLFEFGSGLAFPAKAHAAFSTKAEEA